VLQLVLKMIKKSIKAIMIYKKISMFMIGMCLQNCLQSSGPEFGSLAWHQAHPIRTYSANLDDQGSCCCFKINSSQRLVYPQTFITVVSEDRPDGTRVMVSRPCTDIENQRLNLQSQKKIHEENRRNNNPCKTFTNSTCGKCCIASTVIASIGVCILCIPAC
jgi:hypothetical protein